MSEGWERRQERTRREVIEATGALIAESGLDGLTMRKLAERAGVAVATLYNQFGDRDGVIVAFVSSGLDNLEVELDAQPDAGPIDTTRQLFEALDAVIASEPEVWRPIFASLRTFREDHDLGAVGDRVVAYIATDFSKAAADDLFEIAVDVEMMARHVFETRIDRIQKWAEEVVDWTMYRAASTLGLELLLASVLRERLRGDALSRSGIVDGAPTPTAGVGRASV